jgi:SHAQKYF class myb-like DNA-binding protein
MSLIDSEFMSDLLFPENINNQYFTPSTFSDNLNDFFSEYSQIAPKKDIKFILTKEEYPQQTFLKKKINIKNGDTDQGNSNGGRWTKDEQHRFAEAVLKYGNEWKKIQNHIYSRNLTQVRSHAQKFLMKLKETTFYKNQKLELSLNWTKVMNYLRSNVEFNKLKEILFSVEENEEKNVLKKNYKKVGIKNSNKSKKNTKNNKFEDSLSLSNDSNCDTHWDNSHLFFDNDESSYENNKKENEDLEKFIECFNRTSEDINLNSSFEEIPLQENE